MRMRLLEHLVHLLAAHTKAEKLRMILVDDDLDRVRTAAQPNQVEEQVLGLMQRRDRHFGDDGDAVD
ncbi:hypothetical protein D9M70_440810 [compost metagenome]